MSDVATLNSLIKDVADLGGSIKNVEVDEDERGLILRVPRADGPFDITMPEHLHLDPEDFDNEQGCISEKADMPEPVRAFWNAYIAALFDDDDRAALADIRQAVGSLLEEQAEAFDGLSLNGFLQTERDTATLNRRLLTSVTMGTEQGTRVLPFMGLARQGKSPINISKTISGAYTINGSSANAVIINSGRFDALWALSARDQGHRSMVALSVPLSIPMGQASGNAKPPLLAVGRSPNRSQPYKGAFAPRVIKEGNVLRLTHLTMSFLGRPALAQTIFRSLAKENDIPNPDDLWPRIKAYNMRRLFQAYQVSHGVENARLREKLSDALSLQIETLIESH